MSKPRDSGAKRETSIARLAQCLESFHVSVGESQLLGMAPALDLHFPLYGTFFAWQLLRVDQPQEAALGDVARSGSYSMPGQTLWKVVCMSRVERPIPARNDVNPAGHDKESLDRLGTFDAPLGPP